MEKIHLLHIEKEQADLGRMDQLLAQTSWIDPEVIRARSLEQALSILSGQKIDFILVNLFLPDSEGLDTLIALRAAANTLPVVVMISQRDDDLAAQCLRQGAQDCLVKSHVDAELLQRTLFYTLERHESGRKMAHLNLVLRTLRGVNRLIVNERDKHVLAGKICDQLVEIRGYDNAWIILLDQNRQIIGHASAGPLREAIEKNLKSPDVGFQQCMRKAMAASSLVVLNNRQEECLQCPLYSNSCGNSVLIHPLSYHQRLMGLLWVNIPDEFSGEKQEQELFREIAQDLSFALYNLEVEQQQSDAEQAREAMQQRYHHLFEHVPVGLYVSRPDGAIMDANPAMVRLLGFPSKESLLNVHAPDLYPDAKDRRKWRTLMKSEGQVYQFETVLKRYDGQIIWVLENSRCVMNEVGEVLRFEGSMEDITHRKRIQEKNAFQARMLNAVSQAIIATDPGGVISYWGRGTERVYGWRAREVLGKNIHQVIIPNASRAKAMDIMEALRNGYAWSGELNVRHKDGRVFAAIISSSPVLDEQGGLNSIISVSTDISKLKQTEQSLRRINRAMEILSRCNRELTQVEDEDSFVQRVCHIIADRGSYPLVWIGYARGDKHQTIEPAARAGNLEGLYQAPHRSQGKGTDTHEPVGKALRTGKEVVWKSGQDKAQSGSWQKEVRARNYRSIAAFPLLVNQKAMGILALYAPQREAFDGDEMGLIRELANDVSFGIESMRSRAKQKKLQQDLRQSEEQFRRAVQQAPIPIMLHVEDGEVLLINQTWQQTTGYSLQQIPQYQDWLQLAFPSGMEAGPDDTASDQTGETNALNEKEYTLITQSGQQRQWLMSAAPLDQLSDGRKLVIRIASDITRQKEAEARMNRRIEEMHFLSQAALELIQLTSPDDLYQEVARSIYRLIGQGVVVVSSYDAIHERAKVESVQGIDRQWEEWKTYLQADPVGMQFVIELGEREILLRKELTPFHDNSAFLITRWLSSTKASGLFKTFRIGTVYQMGLSRNHDLLGIVNIALFEGHQINNQDVIHAFVTQASIALQKIISESRLQENERLLERAQEMAHLGSWEVDLNTGQTYWSDELYHICGYQPGEITPSLEAQIQRVHPDDRERVRQAHQKVIDGAPGYELEKRIVRPNGEIRWVYSKGELLLDTAQKSARIIGAFLDITEGKKNEQQIREQVADMRFLSNSALEFIQMAPAKSIYQYIGNKLLDFVEEGLVVVNSYDARNDRYRIEHVEAPEELYRQIRKILGRDPVEMTYSLDNDTTRGYLEPRLRELTPSARAIHRKNYQMLDQKIGKAVRAKQYLGMGLTRDEKLLGSVTLLLTKKTKPEKNEVIQAFLIQSAIALQKVLAEQHLNRQKQALEQVRKELWRSNHELSESNQKLEAHQQELSQALEKARESDQLKSAFLANLSHEIRTPMNAILGFSSLLEKEELSAERKKQFIEIIRSKGDQLMQLINDIIDISKIQSGQFEVQWQSFNLNQLFRELEISYEGQLPEKKAAANLDLRMKTSLDDLHAQVVLDRNRLQQILTNLINNALKFTGEGFIEVGYLPQNSDNILFYVQDTGIGIKKEKQAVIFDQFRQSDTRQDRDYGGTGLGLAIVRNLVELMGGEIWVESEPDQGSTFYFILPWYRGQATPGEGLRFVDEEPQNWKGKTVLIAEDDMANMLHLEELLKDTGIYMLKASDGLQCLKLMREHAGIDLVLMDIKMPGMDGYQALKQIRQSYPDIPVIAQTAYALKGDRESIIRAGFNDYIAKPLHRQRVLAMLRPYLQPANPA